MGEVPLYMNDLCSCPRRARPEVVLTETVLRVGSLWRDKWTTLSGPLAISGPSLRASQPRESESTRDQPNDSTGRWVQGYLAHKKQRPPRTLQ